MMRRPLIPIPSGVPGQRQTNFLFKPQDHSREGNARKTYNPKSAWMTVAIHMYLIPLQRVQLGVPCAAYVARHEHIISTPVQGRRRLTVKYTGGPGDTASFMLGREL